MNSYLGIDAGSVTTKLALLDEDNQLVTVIYLRTQGKPIAVLQEGLRQIDKYIAQGFEICGVATTGSARYLAGVVVGADVVKNEITCHAIGAMHYIPDVQTVVEIGGQDSKIIIIRDGVVTDFGMNTVCAAGTGSFLDHQASRLNIAIEDFGEIASRSKMPVRIAGKCTVFAESDMVHKQQMGHDIEDIVYGLCLALVRNYFNNVAIGKEILPPVVFQGGVAFNQGIVKALEEILITSIIVPEHPGIVGAIGAALLVHEEMNMRKKETKFKGSASGRARYCTSSFECQACPNSCEIVQLSLDSGVLARWGGRCELWEKVPAH